VETWSGTTGLAGKVVRSFAIKSPFLYAMFAALPGDSGIARSSDNGNTWQVIPSTITNAGKSIVSDTRSSSPKTISFGDRRTTAPRGT
jgi:hypothetical protein